MPQVTPNYIDEKIAQFKFSPNLQRSGFDSSFYDHLYSLRKFEFMSEKMKNVSNKSFNLNDYLGLEQFAMEESSLIEQNEPLEINWDLLSDAREKFKKRLKDSLGSERNSDTLKPLILFTVDSFENALMYDMMHPEATNNAWHHTDSIIQKGILFIATDDKDMIREYYPKALDKNVNNNNIGVVATVKDEKKFSGFLVDSRFNAQNDVYLYLKEFANGHRNAKSKEAIIKHLISKGLNITVDYLSYNILLPLKRAAIIGTKGSGSYFISTSEDLQTSLDFHKKKYHAIGQTISLMSARANNLGFTLKE